MRYASRFIAGAASGLRRSAQPLRFAVPNNSVGNTSGSSVSGTQTDGISRVKVTIGSGDLSDLVLSFHGWNLSGAALLLQANAYTVVGCYVEKGDGSQSVQVTFGGSGTKVINAGDTDIQADACLPSSFGLATFARDSIWWIRLQLRAATGVLPNGSMLYNDLGYTANVGLRIDPAVYVSATVGGTGIIPATGSGWTDNYKFPFTPIVLGHFVSGDPVTILGLGNSIMAGAGDTQTNGVQVHGAFQRALFNSDLTTGAIGGCNMGSSGAKGSLWQGTNNALGKAYWKYAKHAVEEFGTNEFITVNTSAAAKTSCQLNWTALRTAGVQNIIRPLMTPRTAGQHLTAGNISGSGTTVTITGLDPAFVATIGGAGATKTLAIQGVTPAGYNTTTAGTTFTVVDSVTLSYSNATTAVVTVVGTINDLYTTTTSQTPLNTSWQSGGGAWDLNDWLPTQVGASGPTTILSLNSVRAGTTPDTTAYYTWAVDGTAYKYVFADNAPAGPTLGVHPSIFGHNAEAAEYRTAFAALL